MNFDENYWLSVAAQWIQSKSQTQMSFPQNFPQLSFPQAPEPPRISSHDPMPHDNLGEADMDIEDVKEDEPISQIWNNNWQSAPVPTRTASPVNIPKPLPAKTNNHNHNHNAQKFPTNNRNQSNRPTHQHSRFDQVPQAPSAPKIGQLESSQSVDMVLDSADEEEEDGDAAINEAQKRKKLPVWIREGLERIEREKKQEAMRIQREKEMLAEEENRKKMMEEALKELEREKASKSKYDSESDEEVNAHEKTPETEKYSQGRVPDIQDDEDAFEKMMLLVRKIVTEILIEVTDEKIQEISKETLTKYRKKASSVTSNRTVTNSLGLGVYSNSSDDDSEAEDNEKDDQSDLESEAVLKERIRVKAIAFEHRAKEIIERLAKTAEMEQERFKRKESESQDYSRHKSRFDSDDEKPQKPQTRKVDGEEKYDQIYSISSSYASGGRQRDKKKSRFNDPKERTASVLVTHVGMLEPKKPAEEIVPMSIPLVPQFAPSDDKKKSRKRSSSSSSSTTSSSASRHKKHKKHKKSSKHSKKSSKKRDRSNSRSRDRDRQRSHKSDRHSMESKTSVRSSESRRNRSRSRSRSRQRSRRY